jgi:hypothetical protein
MTIVIEKNMIDHSFFSLSNVFDRIKTLTNLLFML